MPPFLSDSLRVHICAATIAIFGALAAAADARASAAAAFHTPGNAVECLLPVNHAEGARTPWRLMCWTPNDGFAVEMSYNGRVRRTSLRALRMSREYVRSWASRRELRFGKDWSWYFEPGGYGSLFYVCSSRATGLTCKNRAGHGWWIGRYRGYRLF